LDLVSVNETEILLCFVTGEVMRVHAM